MTPANPAKTINPFKFAAMLSPMTESDASFLQAIVVFLWWLIASGAVSLAAEKRGYGQGAGFWLSFFLSAIFAVILLNAYPRKAQGNAEGGDGLSITPPTL